MTSNSDNVKYISLEDDKADRSSSETLLGKEQFDIPQERCSRLSFYRRHERSILWNCSLFILNVIVCIGYTHWLKGRFGPSQPVTSLPTRETIRHEGKVLDLSPVYLPNGTLNPHHIGHFNGKPSPQVVTAWRSVMQHQNLALPKEAFGSYANDESLVQLTDGSGYYGTLSVYHSLHCLKRLHHFVHRDSYYPDLDGEGEDRLLFHTEHCIDYLRQYVQCNADTTLIPFYWGRKQRSPLAVDKAKHQCVDWDQLEQWSAKHSFDEFTPGIIEHPIYGNIFGTDGKGDTIGIAIDDHPIQSRDNVLQTGH